MSFGLTGSHRSGKTTLAQALAKEMGVAYLDASTTEIMREIGFDPVGLTASLDQRLEAQEHLLLRYMEKIRKAPRPFIADRTPLDMAAYMLGEVTMRNATLEEGRRIHKYVEHCLTFTRTQFAAVLAVRPLPVYAVSADKPPENPAYQWAHQYLVEGLISRLGDEETLVAGSLRAFDLRVRIDSAKRFFETILEEEMRVRDATGTH